MPHMFNQNHKLPFICQYNVYKMTKKWKIIVCWFQSRVQCSHLFAGAVTWSMTLALNMASSMCFSSDLMTHLMLLTTCWTSGGRLQLECSRNLATSILVSLYILRSARECGRSSVCGTLALRWRSTFLPSLCCFLADMWAALTPILSAEISVGPAEIEKNVSVPHHIPVKINK